MVEEIDRTRAGTEDSWDTKMGMLESVGSTCMAEMAAWTMDTLRPVGWVTSQVACTSL